MSFVEKTSKIQWFQYGCLGTSILFFIFGRYLVIFDLLAVSMMLLLINNVVYSFQNIKKRFLFLIFQCMIFTFIVSRPFIGMLRNEQWWKAADQSVENVYFAINVVMLSLFMLFVGVVIAEKVIKNEKNKYVEDFSKKEIFRENLQVVSMVVFYITMFFFLIQGGEKLVFMRGKAYVEYYTSFQRQFPNIFYTIASFMKYSMCIFLATLPSKKRAFIPLAIFEISAIPELLIGIRNPIMLNSLFIFIYYVIRDIKDGKKQWIGKVEKVILAIAVPASLVFMAAYSYLRSGLEIAQKNIFRLFLDFFYGQGVTFNVLAISYGYKNNLPERPWRNYTFGGMIDYIYRGRIGQLIFGTEALPEGNNWSNGRLSNNLSHNISYVSQKERYMNGNGWGSSYMLENYIDFGYIGVAVFSIILGMILIYMLHKFGKSSLMSTVMLVSLTSIFFSPRAEATGWLTFIVTLQFWLCILICYISAYVCIKWQFIQKCIRSLNLYPKVE